MNKTQECISSMPASLFSLLLAFSVLFAASSISFAQQTQKRGIYPAGSFQTSEVDIINASTGNLSMRFPLGALPPSRGEVSAGIGIYYNSKLFDSYRNDGLSDGGGLYAADMLVASQQGGWQYGYEYKLRLLLRPNSTSYVPCQLEYYYIYRLVMIYPDGSEHEFRPVGYNSALGDGYYNITPFGYQNNCTSGGRLATNMVYYSTDGSYARLEIDSSTTTSVLENTRWNLFFSDGSKITYNEQLPGGGIAYQRFYDRNGNWAEVKNVTLNGHPATKIVDEFQREVVLERSGCGTGCDTVTAPAPNGQTVVWQVTGRSVTPTGSYSTFGSDGYDHFFTFPATAGISQISLPSQAGSLLYSLTYNCDNYATGAGEIKDLTLPTTAKHTYVFSTEDPYATRNVEDVLKTYITQKQRRHYEKYDGVVSSTPTVDNWYYYKTVIYNATGGTITETKAPDNGWTREYAYCQNGTPCGAYNEQWKAGIVWKTENPDGTCTERLWATNSPTVPAETVYVNPYIKTEFVSIKEGPTLSKTAIKDYTYDKNGNLTQVVEYDWVPYNTIPRDSSGIPTGIPTSAASAIKRVTVNTYHVDLSNTNNYYFKTSAPKLLTAVKSKELRSTLTSGTASRVEYDYDNATTTGNLTVQREWDSRKGRSSTDADLPVSDPLTSNNSISITQQYSTWPSGATGKRTQTTDANGATTTYEYGDIDGAGPGPNELYVTKTEVAANYGTLKRTYTSQYDFNSGLTSEAKDFDNNVSTLTTYDFFGRPTLVREAANTTVERQVATTYSDVERRVIVQSSKDTTTDGKVIEVQHFDQLGRLCLSRSLESGLFADAPDETKGTKIQYRYRSSGNNYYELVSAPYNATTSTGAASEPGMAWKRTKFDQGGRVIELETFGKSNTTAGLPAPWGSSTDSTGKVTTAYDAEYTTVTDQAAKTRRSRVNGLGQLVRVDEPDTNGNLGATSSPAQPTAYTYNTLGNLITTSQTGVPNGGSSSVTQTRTFTYGSLGRLISATNPESGTISYEYDNNGNLKKKTDARGIFITYTYDALNRNLTVNYSNTAVPDITRVYDPPIVYGKGRFWHSYAGGYETPGAREEYREVSSYDALGRPLVVRQYFKETNNFWSQPFTTSQTYDLAGNVKTKTYPSGHSATYNYDNEGKLSSFTGNLGNGTARTYSTGIIYNAQGQMLREQFGTTTALYHNCHYNRRGQLYDVRLSTSSTDEWSWNRGALRMYFNSDYSDYNTTPTYANNNGNLYRQDHFVPDNDAALSWSMAVDYFGYDSLNRVTGIAEQSIWSSGAANYATFSQNFSYDRFGNRLVSSATGTGVPNPGFKINGPDNRLIASTDVNGTTGTDKMQYDASGNLVKDAHTQAGAGTRTYDAENRMLTAIGLNGQTQSYAYDADGRRTRRLLDNGNNVWWQVFGVGGELVAEYQLVSGTPTLKKEYGYRNGQLLVIAEAASSNCQWLVTDALGTPRILADETGLLSGIKRRDYLPFGEEVSASIGHRTTTNGYASAPTTQPRQQFTGKERDSETGLDYFEARYYGSLYGRFTSPDEFTGGPDELYDFAAAAASNPTFYAELIDPQSLNKYQYCYNNPIVYVDSNGHQASLKEQVKRATATVSEVATGFVQQLANDGPIAAVNIIANMSNIDPRLKQALLIQPYTAKPGSVRDLGMALGLTGELLAPYAGTVARAFSSGAKAPVVLDLFGGTTSQISGAINVDIIATQGVRASTTALPFASGVAKEVIASGPRAEFLSEAARVLQSGGKIFINTSKGNRFGKLPSSEVLQKLGLKVVQDRGPLLDRFKNLVFRREKGTVIPTESITTTILEKM